MSRRYLALLLVLLAALGAGLATLLLERHHTLELPLVPWEIQRQSFYAVGQTLAQQHRQLRTIHGAPQLFSLPPPGQAVLVFDGMRGGLAAERIEALYQWVADGGTLIVQASDGLLYTPADRDTHPIDRDPLLAPLNLQSQYLDHQEPTLVSWADSARLATYGYSEVMSTCYPDLRGGKAARAASSAECLKAACEPEGSVTEQWFRWPGQPPRAIAFQQRLALSAPQLQRAEAEDEEEPLPTRHKQRGENGQSLDKGITRILPPVTKQAPPTAATGNGNGQSKHLLDPPVAKDASAARDAGERKRRPHTTRSSEDREAALREMYQRVQQWPMTIQRLIGSNQRAHLLDVQIGDGHLVVMTDLQFWGNDALQYLDHAWLLGELMGDARSLWLIEGFEEQSFFGWLWQRATALWLLLAVLIGACVWHALPRRQPRVQRHSDQPSDLRAHFSAGSRLLWRAGQQQALLAPLRKRVQQLRQRHPGLAEDDVALAAHAGLTPARLDDALHQQPLVPMQLIALINDLQQIRRSL